MNHTTIFIVILISCLGVSLFFVFNGQQFTKIKDNQIEALQNQRDSILTYTICKSKQNEQRYKQVTDSLINYGRIYVKADSLNKIQLYNKQREIRLLTRAGRDRLRDSIFKYNNIPYLVR